QFDVADAVPTDVRQEAIEWERALVVAFERFGEQDCIDRSHAQLAEKKCFGTNDARVLATVEVAKYGRQIAENLFLGLETHEEAFWQKVTATIRSFSRVVWTRSAAESNSGQAAASAGPSTTCTIPLCGSAARTKRPLGPSARPWPTALATASLAHQK